MDKIKLPRKLKKKLTPVKIKINGFTLGSIKATNELKKICFEYKERNPTFSKNIFIELL